MLTKLNRVWSLQPLKSRVLDTKKILSGARGLNFQNRVGSGFFEIEKSGLGSGRAFKKMLGSGRALGLFKARPTSNVYVVLKINAQK